MESSSGSNHRDLPEETESSVAASAVQDQPEPPLCPDLPAAGEEGCTAAADGGNDDDDPLARSSEILAKGLSSMLSSVIKDFDFRARETLSSQDQLSSAIDRLTRELDQLLEDAPLPFIMQHAAKISSVRKRVSSLNLLLRSIQGRIDNIDRLMSIGNTHGTPDASWLLWLDMESGQKALYAKSAPRATEDFDNTISCSSVYNMSLTKPKGLERRQPPKVLGECSSA